MVLFSLNTTSLILLLLLPVAVLQVLLLVLLPSLHAPGARAAGVLKATYSYAFQAVGIGLMTAGALPAVRAVLEKFVIGVELLSPQIYLAFLMIFSAGGATFLWHERIAESIDDASRRVPALLFWYTFKTIGFLMVIMSAASLVVTMLLHPYDLLPTWWMTPAVTLAYGSLLCWCSRTPQSIKTFNTVQVARLLPTSKKRSK